MIKYILYTFIVIGLLGLLTFIPGFNDELEFYYLRFQTGDSIEVNEQCYLIPKPWIVDSKDIHSGEVTYTLRKNENNEYYFSTVIYGNEDTIPHLKSLKPLKIHNDVYRIYKLSNLSEENPVRYWLYLPKLELILLGESIEQLESLSLNLMVTQCNS
ncbi:MAG: hypothetical protein GQ546_08160 [Gammaproteobacteria bacterium]|nr:hypothetical protein [Gammaproteobacteria bacterium]